MGAMTATFKKMGEISPTKNAGLLNHVHRNDASEINGDQYLDRFHVGMIFDFDAGHLTSTWTTQLKEIYSYGFTDGLGMNIQSYRENDATQGPAKAFKAAFPRGEMKYVPCLRSCIDSICTSLTNNWYPLSSGQQTPELATSFAETMTAQYNGVNAYHNCVTAYLVGDDVTNTNANPNAHTGPEVNKMITAFQGEDPRPASAIYRDGAIAYSQVDSDNRKIIMYSIYPKNMNANGFPPVEGDIGSTFASDIQAMRVNAPNAIFWWALQAHSTIPLSNPNGPWSQFTKSYPLPADMSKQFWIAVGEGIKGIFWFTWNSQIPNPLIEWYGLGHINRRAELLVASDCAKRLNEGIRKRLMRADRVAAKFTASGGGASFANGTTYTNAYISTLHDPTAGVYYVVLLNHAMTPSTITVSGSPGFTTGTLTDLTNGTVFNIGSSVVLPPYHGTIYMWTP